MEPRHHRHAGKMPEQAVNGVTVGSLALYSAHRSQARKRTGAGPQQVRPSSFIRDKARTPKAYRVRPALPADLDARTQDSLLSAHASPPWGARDFPEIAM